VRQFRKRQKEKEQADKEKEERLRKENLELESRVASYQQVSVGIFLLFDILLSLTVGSGTTALV